MIDLDLTLFIQLFNFFVTLVVLNVLLIRPVREIIRKRRETTAALTAEADGFLTRANTALENYESALRTAREEGGALRRQAREEAENGGQRVLAEAHADAHRVISQKREATMDEVRKGREALRADIPSLTAGIFDKLVGALPVEAAPLPKEPAPKQQERKPARPKKKAKA
ncbi:MAG TPA: ATP synthase F0 subunit B [Candidatus Avidesulfovibrio excrementigallinarum]|nr:ATP synthase F0 subunit B [Candidatus Avidesulfovibrio excrementigallinarum]